jgi:hypothetical protein
MGELFWPPDICSIQLACDVAEPCRLAFSLDGRTDRRRPDAERQLVARDDERVPADDRARLRPPEGSAENRGLPD